jgi:hypothetical protein
MEKAIFSDMSSWEKLFQGRYKAIICERNKYLLALVRYIHLNAVRAKLASRPERYQYSGHNSYLTNGTANRRGRADLEDVGRQVELREICPGREWVKTTTSHTTPWPIGAFWEKKALAEKSVGTATERREQGKETDRNGVQGSRRRVQTRPELLQAKTVRD